MINQLLLIFYTIIIYELLKLFKFKYIIKSNFEIYKKIIKLFNFKQASDFRKQKLLFNYTKSLLVVSIKIFSIIICILIIMLLLNQLSTSFLNLVISVFGIIEITLFFIIYHKLKKKIDEKL